MGTPQFGEHKNFWDKAARDDLLIAILDNAGTRSDDPEAALAEFRRQGILDAGQLAAMVHPTATAVDLGCGIGRVLEPLSAHCARAVGVDVSTEMIARGREYVGADSKIEFVRTDGRTLPGVEDGTVDLLYALLVLIHVDRRSAFHYFRETRRALRQDGIARFQFHDIESESGLEKFLEFVDTEYPLEFYAEAELHRTLGAAGLEILSSEPTWMYRIVNAVPGSAEAWRERFDRDVQVVDHGADGAFEGAEFDTTTPGRRWIRLHAAKDSRRSLTAMVSLGNGESTMDSAPVRTQGVLALEAGEDTTVEFIWDPAQKALSILANGAPAAFLEQRNGAIEAGAGALHLGLVPPGHYWAASTMQRFPALFELKSVTLRV